MYTSAMDILRIMDCFLSEGRDVIFRISLALLLLAKDDLLLRDIEGVTQVLGVEWDFTN